MYMLNAIVGLCLLSSISTMANAGLVISSDSSVNVTPINLGNNR